MARQSLYERIGGDNAVKATVVKMYEKVLADDLLAKFFSTTNVEALRHSQSAFVTFAFGGPNAYTGRSMRDAHRNSVNHGLSDQHFDRVVAHLQTAMRELNVPEPLIQEATAIVETTRNDVLNR